MTWAHGHRDPWQPRRITTGRICPSCKQPKSKADFMPEDGMLPSGFCRTCELVSSANTVDDILAHIHGHDVETISCHHCAAEYPVVIGLTYVLESGIGTCYCPWCDVGPDSCTVPTHPIWSGA